MKEPEMRRNADTTRTLADLLRAMDAQTAVTVRYVKANGEVSRRGVEIMSVRVTESGNIVLVAMDRRSGERRTFRLDRITGYTMHRSEKLAAYRVPVTADVEILMDEDTDEIIGFRAWDETFVLSA